MRCRTLDQPTANIILPRSDVRCDRSDKSDSLPRVSTTIEVKLPRTGIRSMLWQSVLSFASAVGHDHLDHSRSLLRNRIYAIVFRILRKSRSISPVRPSRYSTGYRKKKWVNISFLTFT